MRQLRPGLLALALLASALIAGFFYAYQVSVVPGLADADPTAAIAAMQGINRTVRTGAFAFSFFGALGFGLAAALAHLAGWRRPVGLWLWTGVALYGVGAFTVTFAFNVPLNEALAPLRPSADEARAAWAAFASPWLFWNGVRTVASTLAFGCFAAALWCEARGSG